MRSMRVYCSQQSTVRIMSCLEYLYVPLECSLIDHPSYLACQVTSKFTSICQIFWILRSLRRLLVDLVGIHNLLGFQGLAYGICGYSNFKEYETYRLDWKVRSLFKEALASHPVIKGGKVDMSMKSSGDYYVFVCLVVYY